MRRLWEHIHRLNEGRLVALFGQQYKISRRGWQDRRRHTPRPGTAFAIWPMTSFESPFLGGSTTTRSIFGSRASTCEIPRRCRQKEIRRFPRRSARHCFWRFLQQTPQFQCRISFAVLGEQKADRSRTAVQINRRFLRQETRQLFHSGIQQLGAAVVYLKETGGEISKSKPQMRSRMVSSPKTVRVLSPKITFPSLSFMFCTMLITWGALRRTSRTSAFSAGQLIAVCHNPPPSPRQSRYTAPAHDAPVRCELSRHGALCRFHSSNGIRH